MTADLHAGDLTEIEQCAALDGQGATADQTLALVAEVRRLLAIEDAARSLLARQREDVGQQACEFTIPCPKYHLDDVARWCEWCHLVIALEASDG